MFSSADVDGMLAELEQLLPGWAARHSEAQFGRMLAAASDYICRGVDPDARAHALTRLGVIVEGSGYECWSARYSGVDSRSP